MVAVTAGELSPIVAGIVYCNTIAFCQDVYELRRAREWTAALTRWCEQQPDMVAHKGLCLVHRAQIMTLGGDWQDALEEARRVGERFTQGVLNERALGHAVYRQGEIFACGATSGRPRRPTGTRAGSGGSPNQGSPCCAWPKATPRGRRRDSPRAERGHSAAEARRSPACLR